jgi:hypothetical protein
MTHLSVWFGTNGRISKDSASGTEARASDETFEGAGGSVESVRRENDKILRLPIEVDKTSAVGRAETIRARFEAGKVGKRSQL